MEDRGMKNHVHDCNHCIYLGSDKENDYYYHYDNEYPILSTLICRYGPDGDYSSGLEFIMSNVGLNKALALGVQKGVFTSDVLEYMKAKQVQWFDYCLHDTRYAKNVAERWEGLERFTL
jgi:hypothetical protein